MDEPELNLVYRPYTLIVDSREQSSYDFRDIEANKAEGGGTIVVKTKRDGLKTGDYSIEGFEDKISVERKEISDLFNCVGGDRDRFERQLFRLNELDHGFVVVEADWARIMRGVERSKLDPKTVSRSVIGWQQRKEFRNVHWWMAPGKRFAEK